MRELKKYLGTMKTKKIGTVFLVLLLALFVLPATTQAASKEKLSKGRIILYQGGTAALEVKGAAQRVTWKSSDRSVVTSRRTGKTAAKLTAKKAGTATMTATVGGKSYKCKVTVKKLKLNKKKETVLISYSKKLKVNDTSRKATWKSSNPKVAAVDSEGNVTGKKAGTATITATVGKRKLKCKVTVPKYRLHVINWRIDEGEILLKDVRTVYVTATYDWIKFGLKGLEENDIVTWELVGSKHMEDSWMGPVERIVKLGLDGRTNGDMVGYKTYSIFGSNDESRNLKSGTGKLKVKINGKPMFTVTIKVYDSDTWSSMRYEDDAGEYVDEVKKVEDFIDLLEKAYQ